MSLGITNYSHRRPVNVSGTFDKSNATAGNYKIAPEYIFHLIANIILAKNEMQLAVKFH